MSPRNYRICSIPFSGTRFVQSFFAYLNEQSGGEVYVPDCYHVHDPNPMRDDDFRLVIPLRHPHQVFESMTQAYWPDVAEGADVFCEQWQRLIDYAESRPSIRFHVERKSTKTERATCEFLGIPWQKGFSWKKVGANPRKKPDTGSYKKHKKKLQFAVDWFDGR